MKFLLDIITPEKIVFSEEVAEVIVPTADGTIGVLPNHSPLASKIIPGELLIKKDSNFEPFAITGGFLEVGGNKVTVLADYAIQAKDIELAKAEEAKERAEKLMKEKVSEEDFAMLQGELERAIAMIKVARKHRKRIPIP